MGNLTIGNMLPGIRRTGNRRFRNRLLDKIGILCSDLNSPVEILLAFNKDTTLNFQAFPKIR